MNGNGKYDGPNGVWDGDTMIWTSIRVLFTDDTVNILLSPTPPYTIPAGGSVNISMSLTDGNGNPLLPGTKITLTKASNSLASLSTTEFDVPQTIDTGPGKTDFSFTVSNKNTGTDPVIEDITVSVDTGRVTQSRTIVVTLEGQPAP